MENIFLEVRDQIIMSPPGKDLLFFRSQLWITVLNFSNENGLLETDTCSYVLRLHMRHDLDFLVVLVEGETYSNTDEWNQNASFLLVDGASDILT